MNRVFVTGGTGFVGREVTKLLIAQGHQVGLLVRNLDKAKDAISDHTCAEFFAGDLFEKATVSQAMNAFHPDTVIHMGWNGITGQDRNNLTQLQNQIATIDVVQEAIRCGARTIVGLGSQAEYGLKEGIIKETDLCEPVSLYGACKLASFHVSAQLSRLAQVRFVWLRLFSCYGPFDTPNFMVPMVIKKLLNGESPSLTEARQLWDYLFVADAATAIVKAAVSSSVDGIMNLGSGAAVSVRSFVEQLRDFIDSSLPLGFGQIPYGPQAVMHLQADIAKLESIGWRPTTTLADGIKQTVKWHRDGV